MLKKPKEATKKAPMMESIASSRKRLLKLMKYTIPSVHKSPRKNITCALRGLRAIVTPLLRAIN